MNRFRIFHRKQRLRKAKCISKLDATLKKKWAKKGLNSIIINYNGFLCKTHDLQIEKKNRIIINYKKTG